MGGRLPVRLPRRAESAPWSRTRPTATWPRCFASLQSEADYRALVARFGIDRTSAGFWPNSDALARAYADLEPVDAGILDFGRLENR